MVNENSSAARAASVLVAAVLSVACSPSNSAADAGPGDAGADAGSRSDAGSDAGAPSDAGTDAGTPSDAGSDAGAPSDAGASSGGAGSLSSDGGATTHILLFGGLAYDPDAGAMSNSPGAFLGDTWIWDGTAWTQLAVQGPPARWGSIGGVLNGKAVLFGGTGVGSALLGDTWVFDGAAWTQADVPGPSPRAIAQGGVLGGEFVLYGGYDIGNDLWTWDGGAWTERFPASLDGPAPAVGLANSIYEGALFLTTGSLAWSWDGGAVTPIADGGTLPGPSTRADALAATLGDSVVMWGGASATDDALLDETWLWDGAAWSQPPTPEPPLDQAPAGMVSVGHEVVLLAGTAPDGGAPQLQMWRWDGGTWARADVAVPPYRSESLLLAY